MLEELYNSKKLDTLSKYYIVSKSMPFQSDYRFKGCEDKDREELFQDFLDNIVENEREMRKESSAQHISKLKKLSEDSVMVTTKWAELESLIESKNAEDHEFFNYTDPMERLTAFEETIRDLEREKFK